LEHSDERAKKGDRPIKNFRISLLRAGRSGKGLRKKYKSVSYK
jgi:hypothetical protein